MKNFVRKFSSTRLPDPVIGILKSIVLFLAIGYAVLFLVVATLRLAYPYELEWIEGAYVDQAMRIAQGCFPHSPPNVFLIPIPKTPVFFYLSAGMMKIFGFGFLSILSTFGICIVLVWLIKGESKSWVPGIMAAGIYIASFRSSGAWNMAARVGFHFSRWQQAQPILESQI